LDGVHRDLDSDEEEEGKSEVQRLLSDIGDINYVRFHLGKERKVISKHPITLSSKQHFSPSRRSRSSSPSCTSAPMTNSPRGGGRTATSFSWTTSRKVCSPAIFFAYAFPGCSAEHFDPVKHFNTPKMFLGRTFNRPKADQISKLTEADAEKLKVPLEVV
jgi:hypothetical protein